VDAAAMLKPPFASLLTLLLALALAACGADSGEESYLPPGGGPGPKLAWAPPRLDDPERVTVPPGGGTWGFPTPIPADRDCVVDLPDTVPVTGPVIVVGCRDVVVIGGQVVRRGRVSPGSTDGVGIWIRDWSGTAHLEGLRLGGSGLSDALWLSSFRSGSTAQVENVRVDGVRGVYRPPLPDCAPAPPQPHPDLIQLFQGPERLLLDRFTGYTTYQGIFDDSGDERPRRILRDLTIRRSNIELVDGRCGAASIVEGSVTARAGSPTTLHRFYVEDNGRGRPALIPNVRSDPSWWGGVTGGRPPGGDFAQAADVGLGYRSPGYLGNR
jgi:hypothetical protein